MLYSVMAKLDPVHDTEALTDLSTLLPPSDTTLANMSINDLLASIRQEISHPRNFQLPKWPDFLITKKNQDILLMGPSESGKVRRRRILNYEQTKKSPSQTDYFDEPNPTTVLES